MAVCEYLKQPLKAYGNPTPGNAKDRAQKMDSSFRRFYYKGGSPNGSSDNFP